MSRSSKVLPRIGLGLMALLSLPLALLAYGYLFGVTTAPDPVSGNRFLPGTLPAHAALGATALLLGFLQIIPRLRNGYPRVHRWIGRTYVASCLLGGAAGLVLAFGTAAGWVTTFGFGTLALLWMAATAIGWSMARAGRFADHRRWMIRSFALTFAFVTFRLELQSGVVLLGLPFEVSYQGSAVLCWITNLLVAELILRRGQTRVRRQPLLALG